MTNDPRAANCFAFAKNAAGKVISMNLPWEEQPATKYALAYAALIDEEQAKGEHVCNFTVQNEAGVPVVERVALRWFDPEEGEKRLLPGNQNGQHIITSKFNSGKIGPLDLFIEDTAGNIISDVWHGLGLPDGAHVAFSASFRARPPVTPEPDKPTEKPGCLVGLLSALLELVKR